MNIRVFFLTFIAVASLAGCIMQFQKKTDIVIDEIALGKQLFFDPILSEDQTVSCASCHIPQFAFADTVAFSKGVRGGRTARNTPSAMNVAGRPYLFWDGRSPSLEDQVLHPITNPIEMGFNIDDLILRLQKDHFYTNAFKKVYGKVPQKDLLAKAIAAFERTLETGDSPFDRFMNGDSTAVSESAIRGRELFIGKANCFDCHFSPDFTADEFVNIGIFNGSDLRDSGRYGVTKNPYDIGKFKVPGLRNVALTAPYMHNGMFATLEKVIEYYNDPEVFIPDAKFKDPRIKKLWLTQQEKADLAAFLRSLTTESMPRY